MTDARTGTTTQTYNNADQVATVTTPVPGAGQSAQTTTTLYTTALRPWKVLHHDGTSFTNEFYATGNLKKTSGSRTYPAEYAYDGQSRIKTFKTWQNFAGNSGIATTTWDYDPYRGWLAAKRSLNDATDRRDYAYTLAGRLNRTTYARTPSSRYYVTRTYNNAGDWESGYNYYQGWSTPSPTFLYDRRGRLATVVLNGVTTTLTYNNAGQLLTESHTGGLLHGLALTNLYDALGRRTNLWVKAGSLTHHTFGYDSASRLATVKDGTYSAAYAYLANSPLVSQITYKQASVSWMTTTKQYDNLNRLTSISTTHSGPASASYAYQYNDANQRTRLTLADGSYWIYQYDALGQISSGKRYWSDGTPVAGQQFEYVYDDIGNRKTSQEGGDSAGAGLRSRTYSANLQNESWRTTLNSVDIVGEAEAGAAITVNGQSAYRKNSYYQSVLTADTSGGDAYAEVTVSGAGETLQGKIYVPAGPWEAGGHDEDGNVLSQGRWNFTWDGNHRLVRVESQANAPASSKRKVEMDYDWQGRRIRKLVYVESGGAWVLAVTRKYVYDGWRCVAELDENHNVVQTYLWGLDLSGTETGAGGVGGLLAVKPGQGIGRFVAYDGNGNVVGLVEGSGGMAPSAQYEYGPFGEPIRVTGALGKTNPFRWSTKYTDDETDLVYYGYRFYNPSTGRFLSRDPIGEDSGPNLYAFTFNNAINGIDALGLKVFAISITAKSWIAQSIAPGWVEGMNPLNYPNLLLAVQVVKRGTRDNVVDDAIDGLYRLLSQRVLSVDCCGNSVNSINFSSIFTDVGTEGVGTVALIPPDLVIGDDRGYQAAGGSVRFTWMAKGRPDPKAEVLMNSVRSRTSVYIWHRVIGSIRRSNGKPIVTLKLENSKFPSADLFYRIDGGAPVKAGAYAQGAMSLLWSADPGNSTLVE